ncbi:MAG: tetratricopeptide repeat protein [Candidatus Coatesbacteria bacterium]|nr:tetratricopeptide repeat protein [Candidatus Coatesbacteria bacterium]
MLAKKLTVILVLAAFLLAKPLFSEEGDTKKDPSGSAWFYNDEERDKAETNAKKLAAEKKYAEAIKEYYKALSNNRYDDPVYMNDHDATIFLEIGWLHVKNNEFSEAEKSFKRSIKIRPGYVLAHMGLAFNYEKTGKADEAIGEYKEVLTYEPDNAKAMYSLCVLYIKTKRTARAKEIMEEFLKAVEKKLQDEPENEQYLYWKGDILARIGKYDLAKGIFKTLTRLYPDNLNYRHKYMQIRRKIGEVTAIRIGDSDDKDNDKEKEKDEYQ